MNYKPLRSSAPAKSILNAGFRYSNSTATDIRKTFARVRRDLLARLAADVPPQSKSPSTIVPAIGRATGWSGPPNVRERVALIKANCK